MIFLIEYNRQRERKIIYEKFTDSDRAKAENKRLEIELDLNRKNLSHEVVLFEADTENGLKRTHRRYFQSLAESLK